MLIIDRASISIGSSRQRTEIPKASLIELKESILKLGLLHPPSFARKSEDHPWQLVAGERRLRAIDLIAEEQKTFLCGGVAILPGQLPITPFSSSDRTVRFEAELEENIIRVDLPWPDRTRALAELHRIRSAENPKQTKRETAIEVATRMTDPSPANVEAQYRQVRMATVIAQHLDDPTIAKARTEAEAYQLVLKQEEEKYKSELIRRRKVSASSNLSTIIRNGSCIELMPVMDEAQFDLILTDPPYGVNANTDGFRDRTVHHHNYDDSEANARNILQAILSDGFRLTKPKANLFIFTDIKHFQWLQEASLRMAWTPWRFPLIWQKSVAEGLVPWGRSGFVHTYDVIFFATKGQRGLLNTHVDILNFPRVSRSERQYAAEKPVDLLKKLIELSTLPGDRVFDPCAGSGSTLVAAKQMKRHSLGIEIDQKVCDLATVRISEEGTANAPSSKPTAGRDEADHSELPSLE